MTSHFFITNERIGYPAYFCKRKGQIFIYTSHGGPGIKRLPYANTDKIEPCWQYTYQFIDYMLSNSWQKDFVYHKGYNFKREILHTGLPRNDILFTKGNEKQKELIRKKIGIVQGEKIVLYAPTFRYGSQTQTQIYQPDISNVLESLNAKFGGRWKFVVHKHDSLLNSIHKSFDYANKNIIDGTCVEDIQELLLVADALITDYSSVEMDFCLTGRPQFQFFADGSNWQKLCTMNPRELPFPYAETTEELCRNIEQFDEKRYGKDLQTFKENVLKISEDGQSCQKLVQWMRQKAWKNPYKISYNPPFVIL